MGILIWNNQNNGTGHGLVQFFLQWQAQMVLEQTLESIGKEHVKKTAFEMKLQK